MPAKRAQNHSTEPSHRIRCATRALKNARYLRERDPGGFGQDGGGPGFGTGLPLHLLQRVHLLETGAPELEAYPAVAEVLRRHPMPKIRKLGEGSPR